MRRGALISILLVVAALAAYWPVRRAEFLNFDDPSYVTNNPQVFHGLTSEGFRWAFTTFHASNWHPLTWLSHMLDCQMFGKNACMHHWVNLAFHVINSLLVFGFFRKITDAFWRSAFVAALFALHPLHVESVAWISERKDVLSAFFGLLTLWAYARFVGKVESKRLKEETGVPTAGGGTLTSGWYWLALLLYALGLMSKPMLVTWPFVMLLLDYWPLGRFEQVPRQTRWTIWRRLVLEKLPFFALSVASSAVTFWAQKTGGAVVTMEKIPLPDRLANASVAYSTYLANTFWPTKLAVLYPFVLDLPAMKVALAAVGLLGATVLAFIAARRAPYVLAGWLWFVGTLVPVIGLVQVGSQAMADRYTYIPLIGVFVVVAWGAVDLAARWRGQRLALTLGAAVILTGCFICTRLQVGHWRNSLALFSHAVQVTRSNAVAEQNFGYALALCGNQREAIRHFDAALRLWPAYPSALLNRANALLLENKLDEAIAGYREAIRRQPDFEKAYYQLAGALALQMKLDEARTNYLLALRYKPDYAEAHTKLGNLLLLQGAAADAMPHLYEAVRIRPDYADGQYCIGGVLAQQKKFSEAVTHLRAAIKANPDYAAALNDLAWILATQDDPAIRNVPEAIRFATRACELTKRGNLMYLDTLAVAQSEAGQFSDAIRLTEQAVSLAVGAGDERMAAELRRRVGYYRNGQSYRTIPR